MGEVYLARDPVLKRGVALKRMAPDLRQDPYYRQRFMKEAERASKLNDPHIAGMFDVIEADGDVFLVMEYVPGHTLRERIGAPVDTKELLNIAHQCAQALETAHAAGVLHCDIKPENIILNTANRVKILDFGVARPSPESEEKALTSSTLDKTSSNMGGTFAYMAPETLLHRQQDARSDLFSLGVVLYELYAGTHPFRGHTSVATSNSILHNEPKPLREVNPEATPELERIIRRLLEKKPDARYASASELASDLRALLFPGISTPPPVPVVKPSRLAWRAAAMSAGVLALVALALFGESLWRKPVFAEREWMLMGEIENRSGDPLLDRTVGELLQSALNQSSYVNVVPRARVAEALKRMNREGAPAIDPGLGREICQRENFRALMTGRVEQAGAGYVLQVEVLDPWRGNVLVQDKEVFLSRDDLIPAVDRVARHLRKELGESLSQIERSRPLERVTTKSLPALQRYTQAMDAFTQGDLQRFTDLASSAVELDPQFAMAHYFLAQAYNRFGNEAKSRQHLAQAVQSAENASEREKLLIRALDFEAAGQDEKALAAYRQLVELYPDDLQGLRSLADLYIWFNRSDQAIEAQRRVRQIDLNSGLDAARLMHHLNRVNRFDESLDILKDSEKRGMLTPQHRWAAGIALLGKDDVAGARSQFETLRKGGSAYEDGLGQLYLSRVLLYEGRLEEGARELRTGLVLDEKYSSEQWIPVRLYFLARTEMLLGRKAAAQAAVQRMKTAARPDAASDLSRGALAALRLGNANDAKWFAARLEKLAAEQQQSPFTQSSHFTVVGALALAAGKLDDAAEALEKAAVFYQGVDAYAWLLEVHRARGDWAAALKAADALLGLKGLMLNNEFAADWPLAHLERARTLAKLGRAQEARAEYDSFLKLWAKADAGLAARRQAEQERRELDLPSPAAVTWQQSPRPAAR
jgi:tRNA A-37 threonylcarbamoyl transferase component Bud32/Tfp pilus assembly protein PilF